MALINAEAKKNPAIRIKIQHAQESGSDVPDDILQRVVDARLNQSDCRVNGWVLDGFPQSFAQVALLTQMNVKPSLVIFLEQKDEECINRLTKRRLDPFTGVYYDSNEGLSEAMKIRLTQEKNDTEDVVRLRCKQWGDNLSYLEEHFKNCCLALNATKKREELIEEVSMALNSSVFKK